MKIPVLFYHKIGYPPPGVKLRNLYVTPEAFSRQLRYLKLRGFRTLTCEEYFRMRRGERLYSDRTILITFDDGFQNLYTHAFPLLKKFGFTAVIFLVAGDVGKEVVWQDSEEKFPEKLLDWEEIGEMSEYGIDFQSHGYSHRLLTSLSPPLLRRELEESRKIIEDKLGKAVKFFAYPYGVYSQQVKDALRKSGYQGAFTTRKGKEKDDFEIRRAGIKFSHPFWKFIKYVEIGY